ncbi:enhancer of rudimentary homolog [Drosophila pseudoobscura]|uniref:Enhancer of rudimentary homolog n=1 Tax=Drosophila pseudoobscura pseudoobscura TaxID=46245 RepID=A0A6I8V189_DROPS|nr:enhancer of rudimentary homolog [Drosophila pseudoobscura]
MPCTILLLIQPDERLQKRTYSRFHSIDDCVDRVCAIYESVLERKYPDMRVIHYDIAELYDFMDELKDIVCLVKQEGASEYVPRNKQWIKEQIFVKLNTILKTEQAKKDLNYSEEDA